MEAAAAEEEEEDFLIGNDILTMKFVFPPKADSLSLSSNGFFDIFLLRLEEKV